MVLVNIYGLAPPPLPHDIIGNACILLLFTHGHRLLSSVVFPTYSDEIDLLRCSHSQVNSASCGTGQTAGVVCTGSNLGLNKIIKYSGTATVPELLLKLFELLLCFLNYYFPSNSSNYTKSTLIFQKTVSLEPKMNLNCVTFFSHDLTWPLLPQLSLLYFLLKQEVQIKKLVMQ